MLEIACHAWAYNDKPFEEAVGTIARLGFRNIDLGSGPHLDLEKAASQPGAEARRIRTVLDKFHLQLTDIYFMLPYVNSPDPRRREAQLTLFDRLIPFALALGTPGITISPGILHPDGAAHSLSRTMPALMHMSQTTEDTDLRLSFEPHMDSSITTPELAQLVAEAVPGVSISLDYAHFIVQGYSLGDLIPLLPYTAHIHIRQAVKGRLQTPHSQGRIDLPVMLGDLKEADYHGVLTVEYMTTVGWHGMMPVNITQETVKTRDALRQLRQGTGGLRA
jgi:sugar phosphate isomerase/epimerase